MTILTLQGSDELGNLNGWKVSDSTLGLLMEMEITGLYQKEKEFFGGRDLLSFSLEEVRGREHILESTEVSMICFKFREGRLSLSLKN